MSYRRVVPLCRDHPDTCGHQAPAIEDIVDGREDPPSVGAEAGSAVDAVDTTSETPVAAPAASVLTEVGGSGPAEEEATDGESLQPATVDPPVRGECYATCLIP